MMKTTNYDSIIPGDLVIVSSTIGTVIGNIRLVTDKHYRWILGSEVDINHNDIVIIITKLPCTHVSFMSSKINEFEKGIVFCVHPQRIGWTPKSNISKL